jgi:hypothetical protein
MKVIIPIATLVIAASCGKKEDDDKPTSNGTVLEGTWAAACEVDAATSTSSKETKVFTGLTADTIVTQYIHQNCSTAQAALNLRVSTTMTLSGAATTPADALKIDLSKYKVYIMPKNSLIAASYNSSKTYGKTDWAVDVDTEVTNLNEDGTTNTPTEIFTYDIFKITGTNLCFGKTDDTNTGAMAELRPIELESTKCYTKH